MTRLPRATHKRRTYVSLLLLLPLSANLIEINGDEATAPACIFLIIKIETDGFAVYFNFMGDLTFNTWCERNGIRLLAFRTTIEVGRNVFWRLMSVKSLLVRLLWNEVTFFIRVVSYYIFWWMIFIN